MPLLANHIAVVTGAASGIGRAIAVGFAREGARVVLLDINEQAAREVVKEIRDAGASAESFRLDVTRREDCFVVAKEIAAKVGQVSILVNNAGINRRNAFTADADAVLKDWQDIMAINVNGVSINPGPIAFTRTPCLPSSAASARVKPSTACLEVV